MPLYAMRNQVQPCLWSSAHGSQINRRARRSMATLIKAHGQTPWPRWYGVFARQVYTMMQLCRKMALPQEKAVGSMISASRGMRRQLSHAGLATGRLPPLGQQAHARTNAIRRSMAGKQVVVQFDNWYRRRYCSDPVRPDCCLNVTAMSVLHTTAIPMYPGFPTPDDLLQRICCFPSNSSCTPYFVLFIVMPCSIQNFINYNRAFRRRFCLFCCSGRTADLLPLL